MRPWLVILTFVFYLGVDAQTVRTRFEDYRTKVYRGVKHSPKWIHRAENDCPRDELGKCISDEPRINFAGKYFVSVHSCGTGCRYFRLTDLSTGRELRSLRIFDSTEPLPKTADGFPYVVELITKPFSRLLVAQYHIDLGAGVNNSSRTNCRERSFLLDQAVIKPLTKIRPSCRTL